MPSMFIATANIIPQHATLENLVKFIGPLYTVMMAFLIYLFITYVPNAQEEQEDQEEHEDEEDDEQEEQHEEEQKDEEEQEEDEEEEDEEEEQEDEEEQAEKHDDHVLTLERLKSEIGLLLQSKEDNFGRFQDEILKRQENHEQYTINIQKDILKRLSFLERLFRELAISEHRLNSAMLDAMVSLIMASTAGGASSPASHHDKSVSYTALSLRQRFEWMEASCKADGWAHSNRAAQQQFKALQSLSKLADQRERTWLAAVAYSPV
jgi:hypothetical protein